MERLLITCVKNPFDPLKDRDTISAEYRVGASIIDYIDLFNVKPDESTALVVSLNGKIVPEEELASTLPCPGDGIAFCLRPRGNDVWRTVAMIAVLVVATYVVGPYAAGLAEGAGWSEVAVSAVKFGATMAAATAGAAVVNAVFPVQLPTIDTGNLADADSPTYGWDVATNPVVEGRVIPVLYGKHRIVPQIISNHVTTIDDKQYLNVLMAITDHTVDYINNITINDTPISYFQGVEWYTRLGTIGTETLVSSVASLGGFSTEFDTIERQVTQTAIPNFNDTINDYPIGSKLSDSAWVTAQIPGTSMDGIGVAISFPRGLYALNSSDGSKYAISVDLHIQYRKVGDVNWIDFPISKQVAWTSGFTKTKYSDTDSVSIPSNVTVTAIEVRRDTIEEGTVISERFENGTDFTISGNTLTWTSGVFTDTWYDLYYEGVYFVILGYYYDAGTTTITDNRAVPIRKVYWHNGLELDQYEVRVMFASTPPTANHAVTDAYLEFVSARISDDFIYPGVSLLGVKALATDQLSGGMPRFACDVERSVVSIYNPNTSTIEYKDASLVAWATADAILNERYGGAEDTEFFDYDAFDEWATLCEENNWHCNIYIDSTRSLGETLSLLGRLGHAIIVQRGTTWTCIVDSPADPVQTFNVANIVANTFKINYLPLEDRANAIEITFFDSANDYTRQTVEVRADNFDTTDDIIRKTQVTLYGCVSRSQAIEYGKYLIANNTYLKRSVEFEVDIDAIGCMPGDVIWVQHDVPQWGYGSRVVSATTTSVTIGREVTLEPGTTYKVLVRHQDDDSLEERTVVSVSSTVTTDTFSITSPWTKIPDTDAVISFGEVDKVAKKFRVSAITRSQDQRRKITATEYNEAVYAGYGTTAEAIVDTSLRTVYNLQAIEGLRVTAEGKHKSIISLSWQGNAVSWKVYLREPDVSGWKQVGYTTIPEFEIDSWVEEGHTYEVGVSSNDSVLDGETYTITLIGLPAPPADVENFTAIAAGDVVSLSWDAVDDIDLAGYEVRVGNGWEQGTPIVEHTTDLRATWLPPVSGTYQFWIKALDYSGHYSTNATSATVTISTIGANIVVSGDEVSTGLGTFDGMCYISTTPTIALIAGLTDQDVPASWTDQTNPQLTTYTGTNDTTGSYTSPVNDLGVVDEFTARLWSTFTSYAPPNVTDVELADRLDTTYPLDTDQSITSESRSSLFIKTSDDNVTWTDWVKADQLTTHEARYWQWKAQCDVDIPGSSFYYDSLEYVIDVEDVEKNVYNQAIASVGTTFTLDSLGLHFFDDYHVGVTVLGSASLTPTVVKTTSDFTVYLFDATGTGVAGSVDLHIRGY